ncbi:ABC transporter permease [Lichenicoccus sp.]|uniref:ABC transporter permease n=1 Tax=Lichenicoccus sp. TaxID=2781899 RepID=UPI003D10C696
MNSLRSTALEPQPGALRGASLGRRIAVLLPVYGLVVLAVLLAIAFSLILPDSFPTWLNLRSMLSDKAVVAMLSLAATVPMMTGKIDLTVGYGVVLWHILAISLQINGVPWPLAVLIVLALGVGFGLLNGLLVEVAQIDSFIATLGTGTVTYAVALWWTGGRQVIGRLSPDFFLIDTASIAGIPVPAFYVIGLAFLLWLVSAYTPLGRYLYAIGANPRAAELNGIPTRRYVMLAFMASGLITAIAGVVLASRLRVGQASVGLDYLLPALVGAFLGSTTINPGRVNIWGTIVGVVILAIGISGIEQLGGAFWVEPAFNGATLLFAIGLAGWTGRRRLQVRVKAAGKQA